MQFRLLIAGSVLAMSAVLLRIVYTDRLTYLFLLWNLFLAWLPYALAVLANRLFGGEKTARKGGFLPLTLVWLFFYPNAAYMLTDLYHLVDISFWKAQITLWYDLNMLVLYALLGLFLGFFSFYPIYRIWRRFYGGASARLFFFGTHLLCGVGIYLGRFLRWNSWDVLLRPADVLAETASAIVQTPQSLGFVLFMTLILLFFNGTLFILANGKRENAD
ncbi:MAG TPA: DUF1361 domain-containing protein [Bacilli bacterium]